MKIFFLLILFSLSSGCVSSNNYHFINSVTNAASDPLTWGNAITGALMASTDLDTRISLSAMKNNYLFNTQENASKKSDQLRSITRISMNISSLLAMNESVDNQTGCGEYCLTGIRFLSDNILAGITATTTGDIQKITNNIRPNGKCCGFPSAHTSRAFSTAQLAKANYFNSNLPEWSKYTLSSMSFITAYLTGWARIESGAHYPSQVLLGAAYGNFLTHIMRDFLDSFHIKARNKITVTENRTMLHFIFPLN